MIAGSKLGTAPPECMVFKRDPAQLQSSGAKPKSRVLLRGRGRHSHKGMWDFLVLMTVHCLLLLLLKSYALFQKVVTVHHFQLRFYENNKFAEAVPHFLPKVLENDVLSQKTEKTQVSETLATVSGPSLARVSEIWVFGVFWDSTSFWISYG